jgi:hypothetical protein
MTTETLTDPIRTKFLLAVKDALAENLTRTLHGREHDKKREDEIERVSKAIMEDVVDDLLKSVGTLEHQNRLLAEAIGEAVVEAGIVRQDHEGLTGPDLLLFMEDLKASHARLTERVEELEVAGVEVEPSRDRPVAPTI